ncbi:TetR/AcrR family transcriptional regulator [Kribbia dieselivorans]|uniref:TetR/AcrR family transcriptional regulator n=1 Tax=Kribbia dieselivorans TaxID=331526 RepID=UPI000837CCB4|nr:TetR/AcrR family transcriptional regulator [Kribbia dieselivorans]
MPSSVRDDLIEVAHRHLAQHGATGLSLRAIARDLGVVPSALYRHVSGRDQLLTLLIVDAYTDLAETVLAGERACARDDHAGRWTAIADGMRQWAITHPHRWGLLYGTPVAGYDAPASETTPPGTAVLQLLARLAADVAQARAASTDDRATADVDRDTDQDTHRPADPQLPVLDPSGGLFSQAMLEEFVPDAPADHIGALEVADCLVLWSLLIGSISNEIFGQFGPDLTRPEDFHAHVVRRGAQLLGV